VATARKRVRRWRRADQTSTATTCSPAHERSQNHLTATLAGVTFHAWRLGNEKRDVALLGVISGLLGVGTVVTVVV
jgi:hypothetical protein